MFKPSSNALRRAAPRKRVENRAERKPTVKAATICLDGANLILPCTVRDIHGQGARLSGTNIMTVPEYFLLIARSEDIVARARVAWRKNDEIGVKFVRVGKLVEEDRLRREQAASCAKDQEAIHEQQAREEAARRATQQQIEEQMQAGAAIRQQQLAYIGLNPAAPFTESDLKRAYRIKAMKCHPDQGGSLEAFQELNSIYSALAQSLA